MADGLTPTGPSRGPVGQKDILEQCRELLAAGNVAEFNKIRPKGKIDFTGINLAGRNLAGINFEDVVLVRATLAGTNLTGAKFSRATLDRADFSKATLTNAVFGYGTNAQFTCFRGVRAEGANFDASNLTHAELVEGKFKGASFANAAMSDVAALGADFTEASFYKAFMIGATIDEAIFVKANLEQVNLVQATGKNVNFSEANLTRANILRGIFHGERLSFDGAWTRGMDHDPDTSLDSALAKAKNDRDPPTGTYERKELKIDPQYLVDGIPNSNRVVYEAALKELEALVGLKSVKAFVRSLADTMLTQHERAQVDLPALDHNIHLVFTGNPGTGKTTVARIISKILKGIGYLEKGHLVETDRAGMVAGYTGQTAIKTDEVVKQAMGGVLVVDEAYALAPKGSQGGDFGPEAIETLLKRMEDNRGKFVVIACGYTKEMGPFINSNSGLKSRFTIFVNFPDYKDPELIDILDRMADSKKFIVSSEVLASISVLLSAIKIAEGPTFANGRSVRNLFQKITDAYSARTQREKEERNFIVESLKQLEGQGEGAKTFSSLVSEEAHRRELRGGKFASGLDLDRLTELASDTEVLNAGTVANGEATKLLVAASERMSNRGRIDDRTYLSTLVIEDVPYEIYFKEGQSVLEGKKFSWKQTLKGRDLPCGVSDFPTSGPFPEPTEETREFIEQLAAKMTLPDQI